MSRKGQGAELELAAWLRDHGYEVVLTRGSRGPYDILAYRSAWRGIKKDRWLIQVKATNGEVISTTRSAARDLLAHAKKMSAQCAFAIRYGRPIRWRILWFDEIEKTTKRTRRIRLDECERLEEVFRKPSLF